MSFQSADVVIAGGGAIGSAVALTLARRGMDVVLADDAPLGDNASGVAAGMLAPAFEAALDPLSGRHFELFREARDLWRPFAAGLSGAALSQTGALWVRNGENDDMLDRLLGLGAAAEALSDQVAASLAPGVSAPHGAVFSPEDWRLEPRRLLPAMRGALVDAGGMLAIAHVTSVKGDRVGLSSGETVAAGAVVVATGLAPRGLGLGAVEARLRPIKGQAMRIRSGASDAAPTLRARGIYICGGAQEAYVGATMEEGIDDTRVDGATISALRDRAIGLLPGLAGGGVTPVVGVRAGAADGLPLVGRVRDGLFLALGARRNGWLLAPMIADMVADQVVGGAGGARAADFDPARDLSR